MASTQSLLLLLGHPTGAAAGDTPMYLATVASGCWVGLDVREGLDACAVMFYPLPSHHIPFHPIPFGYLPSET